MIISVQGIELEICKGILEGCKNSIYFFPDFLEKTLSILEASSWHKKFSQKNKKTLKHNLLKIGISACPNSCAKSQIKDLGLILRSEIEYDEILCNHCLNCKDTCIENAILFNEKIVLKKDLCVGCSQCVRKCTTGALITSNIYFEVLVGGRLGRHPRFGTPILRISPFKFYGFLTYFMDLFEAYPNIKSARELFNYISFDKVREGYQI